MAIQDYQAEMTSVARLNLGDPDRIRTYDPQLRRLLLCPTELPDPLSLGLQKYKNQLTT